MKPNISCVKSRAILQYVEARNPEQLPMLWRFCEKEAGEEGPERFFSNPDNKISLDLCATLMELAKKATCDDMAAFKAAYRFGLMEHRERKSIFFASPFGLMKDLLREAQKSDRMPGKHIEFVVFSDTHVIVRVHWPKELTLTRDFCLFEQGLYQALPMEHGLPPARLWERTCFFEGGPYCEYEIWWSRNEAVKKPSFKLYFSRKEKAADQPKKSIAEPPAVKSAPLVKVSGPDSPTPVSESTAQCLEAPGRQDEEASHLNGSHIPSSTVSDTAASDGLKPPVPPTASDTIPVKEGPEETTTLQEQTAATTTQAPLNADEAGLKSEDDKERQCACLPETPLTTQNEHMLPPPQTTTPTPVEPFKDAHCGFAAPSHSGCASASQAPLLAAGSLEKQLEEREAPEQTPSGAQIDINRLDAFSKQLGHLFDGLGRMVALMLSQTNMDHPMMEHLKRMEAMLWKGDTLRKDLLSMAESENTKQATGVKADGVLQGPSMENEKATKKATILLVENLETLREGGKEMLGVLGCDVLVAADRDQALEIFRDKSDQIDVVVMDMDMFVSTMKEMKDIKPAIKIFFSNIEYTEEAQRTVRTLGCEGLIQKPFFISDLQRKLQGFLAREPV